MGFSGLEHQDQAHRVRGRLSDFPCAAFRGCEDLLPVSGTVTAHNSAVNITATNYSEGEKKAGWVVANPLKRGYRLFENWFFGIPKSTAYETQAAVKNCR